MYENYTTQSLPNKSYRELLGSALCVFNSNNNFIIENILKHKNNQGHTWYKLIDLTSGKLLEIMIKTITPNKSDNIYILFKDILNTRNRIIHSYQVTHCNSQILATKDKNDTQFFIEEEILLNFIKKNEELSSLLHEYRGY